MSGLNVIAFNSGLVLETSPICGSVTECISIGKINAVVVGERRRRTMVRHTHGGDIHTKGHTYEGDIEKG